MVDLTRNRGAGYGFMVGHIRADLMRLYAAAELRDKSKILITVMLLKA
jgi:hypothetical protein